MIYLNNVLCLLLTMSRLWAACFDVEMDWPLSPAASWVSVKRMVLCVAALGRGSHEEEGNGATLKASWVMSLMVVTKKQAFSFLSPSLTSCFTTWPLHLIGDSAMIYTNVWCSDGKGASTLESCCLNVEPPKTELNESLSFNYYCISGASL